MPGSAVSGIEGRVPSDRGPRPRGGVCLSNVGARWIRLPVLDIDAHLHRQADHGGQGAGMWPPTFELHTLRGTSQSPRLHARDLLPVPELREWMRS